MMRCRVDIGCSEMSKTVMSHIGRTIVLTNYLALLRATGKTFLKYSKFGNRNLDKMDLAQQNGWLHKPCSLLLSY